MTKLEKLDAKIKQLAEQMERYRSQKGAELRKNRNGRLIALGVIVEKHLPELLKSERERWTNWANELDDRLKKKAFAAFELSESKKTEPEAPNQQTQYVNIQ